MNTFINSVMTKEKKVPSTYMYSKFYFCTPIRCPFPSVPRPTTLSTSNPPNLWMLLIYSLKKIHKEPKQILFFLPQYLVPFSPPSTLPYFLIYSQEKYKHT
uniref:Uncharacterized protein n=1 Tax=Octopus bimaculoides TaxID=37653 RepID=A0A0L8I4Y6_OCTBM